MKLIVLVLLLFKGQHPFTIQVSPGLSQFFEYDNVSLSCEDEGWNVWRYTSDRSDLSPCGSGWGHVSHWVCEVSLKPYHSGTFWCQSSTGETSTSIRITVTKQPLVLHSPVHPVVLGQDVTLHCRNKTSIVQSYFYKNQSLIRTELSNHIVLHNVSKLDQNLYSCRDSRLSTSDSSWLLVGDSSPPVVLSCRPNSSELLEYDSLTLSCELAGLTKLAGSGLGGHPAPYKWMVLRFTLWPTRGVSSCGYPWGQSTASGCFLSHVRTQDSASYWCESGNHRSNTVNISVYAVLLQMLPPLPAEDAEVNLTCRSWMTFTSVTFYKDGQPIRTQSSNHMTLPQVNVSHEGEYTCSIRGQRSPPHRLLVQAALMDHPWWWWMVTMVRVLLVTTPYVLSTLLLSSLWRHTAAGGDAPVALINFNTTEEDEEEHQYDVMDEVTTEHNF